MCVQVGTFSWQGHLILDCTAAHIWRTVIATLSAQLPAFHLHGLMCDYVLANIYDTEPISGTYCCEKLRVTNKAVVQSRNVRNLSRCPSLTHLLG